MRAGCCLVFSGSRVKSVTICPGGEVCYDLSRVKSVTICPDLSRVKSVTICPG